MPHEPLSDFVDSLNLTGAFFLKAEFSEPWAINSPLIEEHCRCLKPAPKQLLSFHLVVEGEAIVSLDKSDQCAAQFRVKPGNIVFMPSNALHVLSSAPGLRPEVGEKVILPAAQDGLVRVQYGGGGQKACILCGFMASNAQQSLLLKTFPDILVIEVENLETRRWIEASVGMAARELSSGRIASQSMAADICKLLLIEALRSRFEQSSEPIGWLRGMAHPRMARVLARIHADLASPLRVVDLASEIGMSRSSFVERFTEIIGMTPRRYIITQRMEVAAALLRDSQVSIIQISNLVGYEAPEAFSRAFKRVKGVAPADWRYLERSAA